jgi:hypothetical protein
MKTIQNLYKIVLILTISVFFAIEAKSQTFNYTWDNQSGCDWQIYVYDNVGLVYVIAGTSAPAFSGVGTVPASGCLGVTSGRVPTTIKLIEASCACEIDFAIPSGGVNSTIISDCIPQGCPTNGCDPTNPTTQISVTVNTPSFPCDQDYTIVIQYLHPLLCLKYLFS